VAERDEPFPRHVVDALRELDLAEREYAELLPAANWLARRGEPLAPADAAGRLAARLAPLALPAAPARRALGGPRERRDGVGALLALARTQVSMLRPAFWLLSAGIVAVGTAAQSVGVPVNQALALQALGPLLAYLGATLAFRGMGLRVLECELACPPTLAEITLARLVIVLGYDLALGIAMTWIVSIHDRAGVSVVLLHWLMPLLLVMGVALALSRWLAIAHAAALAYGAWLSLVAIQLATQPRAGQMWTTPATFEVALGIAGAALLALSLALMRDGAPRWLPRT
jgi:hypothetical protein